MKSTPVRKRFEAQLRDNILTMLARDDVESLITFGEARFYVESDDIDKAAESIRKVFGIASLSKAVVTSSDMGEICKASAEYSKTRVKSGQSFAVRARREGTHTYSSMELGKEAGSAIFLANDGLKVNLQSPDVTFYIEVRNNQAFIFDSYIQGPGGLPLGSQGKVVAEVNDDRGVLSAWLMMKRGCKAFVQGTADMSLLEMYDPNLRAVSEDDQNMNFLGKVLGTSLDGLDDVDVSGNIPIYFPTIGMDDRAVEEMLRSL